MWVCTWCKISYIVPKGSSFLAKREIKMAGYWPSSFFLVSVDSVVAVVSAVAVVAVVSAVAVVSVVSVVSQKKTKEKDQSEKRFRNAI